MSHAAKHQIEDILDGYVEHTAPGAVLLTSFAPASTRPEDYLGDHWVGTGSGTNEP